MTDYHDTSRTITKMTLFEVGPVTVSALIRSDGVDLVTKRREHAPTTVQLTVDEARLVAQCLIEAANESATDA